MPAPEIVTRAEQPYVAVRAHVTMETLGTVVPPLNQEVFAWLGQVLARKGDVAGARVEYERALEVEPGDAWVSGVLLPSLDRR